MATSDKNIIFNITAAGNVIVATPQSTITVSPPASGDPGDIIFNIVAGGNANLVNPTVKTSILPLVNLSLQVSRYDILEGEVFYITAVSDIQAPVDIPVTLSFSGTAVKGTDYVVTPEPLVIAAGTDRASATVTAIIDSSTPEPVRTVSVKITRAPGGVFSKTDFITISITDNPGVSLNSDNRIILRSTNPDNLVATTGIIPTTYDVYERELVFDGENNCYFRNLRGDIVTVNGSGDPLNIDDIPGLTELLDQYAYEGHKHSTRDIVGWTTASFSMKDHQHTYDQIDGLTTALLNKSPITHTHNSIDTPWFATVRNSLADTIHPHDIGDISDLNSYAASEHDHTTSEITGLVAALASKSSKTHTHALTDIRPSNYDIPIQQYPMPEVEYIPVSFGAGLNVVRVCGYNNYIIYLKSSIVNTDGTITGDPILYFFKLPNLILARQINLKTIDSRFIRISQLMVSGNRIYIMQTGKYAPAVSTEFLNAVIALETPTGAVEDFALLTYKVLPNQRATAENSDQARSSGLYNGYLYVVAHTNGITYSIHKIPETDFADVNTHTTTAWQSLELTTLNQNMLSIDFGFTGNLVIDKGWIYGFKSGPATTHDLFRVKADLSGALETRSVVNIRHVPIGVFNGNLFTGAYQDSNGVAQWFTATAASFASVNYTAQYYKTETTECKFHFSCTSGRYMYAAIAENEVIAGTTYANGYIVRFDMNSWFPFSTSNFERKQIRSPGEVTYSGTAKTPYYYKGYIYFPWDKPYIMRMKAAPNGN